MKKQKRYQPWLSPTGVEIPTHELRQICAGWDGPTWEAYLKWFETGRKESLITPAVYDILCEENAESIFEQFQQSTNEEKRKRCERLLALLPPIEAEVLRLYFMEGRTEVEIGFLLHRSQTGVNLIKNRALSRLKRGNDGDGMFARRFMKGEISSSDEEPRLWDVNFEHPIKENRGYEPNNHRTEFEQIKTQSLRVALLALSENAQRILFLRHWCGFTVNQTARILGRGVNTVANIEAASITKVKRNAALFEAGLSSGGESCA